MIRFGPSGNSDSFYAMGNKTTLEAPKWLAAMGLNAYEYSFGRGINLAKDKAEQKRPVRSKSTSLQALTMVNASLTTARVMQAKTAEKEVGSLLKSA